MGDKRIIRNKNENCSRYGEFELSSRSFYKNCYEETGEKSVLSSTYRVFELSRVNCTSRLFGKKTKNRINDKFLKYHKKVIKDC